MGHQRAHVDAAALQSMANNFDRIAELVERVARMPLRFDGAVSGRANTADGDALRRALDRLSVELANWSRVAAEIGACLRVGADRFLDAEGRAAARIG